MDDGTLVTASALYDDATRLREQFGAVAFKTGEFVGPQPDTYVVVVPRRGTSSEEALAWCDAQSLGPDDCFARLVSRDAPASSVIVYQS
jgi:hypothetical protein